MAGATGDRIIDLQQSIVPDGGLQTTATSLSSGVVTTLVSSPLASRCRVYVITTNTFNVWIGGSTVTAADGFPLIRNVPVPFPVTDAMVLYAVSDGPTSIRVMELK